MNIYKKHRDFIIYTIYGFLASVINVIMFNVLHNHWHINLLLANTGAWLIANVFSFIVNKKLVFHTNYQSWSTFFKESSLFLSQRLLSLILDNIIMWLGISFLHWNNLIIKMVDQIIVGLVNYLSTQAIFLQENSPMVQRIQQHVHKNK
ncbi:GtrA family protein [Bombilactobacillus folatiphilus]|uniref:GtrA family protein n=1 Tax=Bombilactobacillus folatiphilus TaxID=2923362 RepID=A0ABY4P837_9LACO|nr:GtrA family protein [Bombilactobacillus folatiphilus]UQS81761.1 GtrA family protein [Bombilactobacillus folatiphilus]